MIPAAEVRAGAFWYPETWGGLGERRRWVVVMRNSRPFRELAAAMKVSVSRVQQLERDVAVRLHCCRECKRVRRPWEEMKCGHCPSCPCVWETEWAYLGSSCAYRASGV